LRQNKHFIFHMELLLGVLPLRRPFSRELVAVLESEDYLLSLIEFLWPEVRAIVPAELPDLLFEILCPGSISMERMLGICENHARAIWCFQDHVSGRKVQQVDIMPSEDIQLDAEHPEEFASPLRVHAPECMQSMRPFHVLRDEIASSG
jgi:regulator of extracellular matrix RemA (YlzA/DUF370 family)